MKEFELQFLEAMRADGFEPLSPVIGDDKWYKARYLEEKKPTGTYSLKVLDGEFAIGCYYSFKDSENKFKWHSSKKSNLSKEEKNLLKKQYEEKKRIKEIAELKIKTRLSARLTKYFKNLKTTDSNHPYLLKKGFKYYPVKVRKKTNEIIIPLRGEDGKVWSIQKINNKGGKFLFTGGKKQGSYYSFGTAKDDLSIILICEGFATGLSLRQATNRPVIVAVDTSNLKSVIKTLKKKYPESKFIICADNDQFTKNAKGEPWNPGIEYATKAAHSVGGAYIVTPKFEESNLIKKPTDFNDLHQLEGLKAVQSIINPIIELALKNAEIKSTLPENPDTSPKNELLKGDFDMNFKVLGYNQGTYYYFPFEEKQVVALSAQQHSSFANLFRLDCLEAWQGKFDSGDGKTPDKKIITYATNALMGLAKQKGIFREEDKIRGCGAWIDDNRKILHCGDKIYVNGKETPFEELKTNFTYIAALKVLSPSSDALNDNEAYKLREICDQVTWEYQLSGTLLAGWLVIAPICGALPFRPHIYINGEAESGKSTVIEKIIKPVLGKISINVDGGTTEPAIRQSMGYDARPLVYDEAEKSPHMPAVLELARKASTGGIVKKFGQGTVKVRFCACFSAINPPVNKTSDESRISFMTIKKNRKTTAIEDYNNLLDSIESTLTTEYSQKLFTRTLNNLDSLFKNIEIFQKAARKQLKSARASQVIGTMLAGTYLLSKTDVIEESKAEEFISKYDWSYHTTIEQDTDPTKLLQYLCNCLISVKQPHKTEELSIGDLIILSSKIDKNDEVDKYLRYYGLIVQDNRVFIASKNQNLARLLKDTDWSIDWRRMLLNIDGSKPFKVMYFSVGCKTSGVSLPLSLFKEESAIQPELEIEEIPF